MLSEHRGPEVVLLTLIGELLLCVLVVRLPCSHRPFLGAGALNERLGQRLASGLSGPRRMRRPEDPAGAWPAVGD